MLRTQTGLKNRLGRSSIGFVWRINNGVRISWTDCYDVFEVLGSGSTDTLRFMKIDGRCFDHFRESD